MVRLLVSAATVLVFGCDDNSPHEVQFCRGSCEVTLHAPRFARVAVGPAGRWFVIKRNGKVSLPFIYPGAVPLACREEGRVVLTKESMFEGTRITLYRSGKKRKEWKLGEEVRHVRAAALTSKEVYLLADAVSRESGKIYTLLLRSGDGDEEFTSFLLGRVNLDEKGRYEEVPVSLSEIEDEIFISTAEQIKDFRKLNVYRFDHETALLHSSDSYFPLSGGEVNASYFPGSLLLVFNGGNLFFQRDGALPRTVLSGEEILFFRDGDGFYAFRLSEEAGIGTLSRIKEITDR